MSLVAFCLIRTTYTWDKEYGLPCIVVSFEGLQTSAVPLADCREVVCLIRARGVVLFAFACASPASHVPWRSTFGLGSKAAYIGYSPADDLSVDCRRMGC